MPAPTVNFQTIPVEIKKPVDYPQPIRYERNNNNRRTEEDAEHKNNINKKRQTKTGDTKKDVKINTQNTDNKANVKSKDKVNQELKAMQKALAKMKALEEKRKKETLALKKALEEKQKKEALAQKRVNVNNENKENKQKIVKQNAAKKAVKKPTTQKVDKPKPKSKPKPTNPLDAIFAKIKVLEKKGNWKKISSTLRRNRAAGNSKEGLIYQIKAALNAKKISYASIGRFGSKLLRVDKKSSWGNYAKALGYYYAKGKRRKVDKALTYLGKALKAKKVAPGASKLYWTIKLKKMWLIILIILGGIVAGIDYLRKKKKASISLESDEESSEEASTSKENKGSIKGKLATVKQKLMPILSKIPGLKNKFKDDESSSEEETEEVDNTDGSENSGVEESPEEKAESSADEENTESDETNN